MTHTRFSCTSLHSQRSATAEIILVIPCISLPHFNLLLPGQVSSASSEGPSFRTLQANQQLNISITNVTHKRATPCGLIIGATVRQTMQMSPSTIITYDGLPTISGHPTSSLSTSSSVSLCPILHSGVPTSAILSAELHYVSSVLKPY